MLYQELLTKKRTLEKRIQMLKQKLDLYPPGYLLCVRNGKYIKNIYVKDGVHTHIPKKNLDFAKTLAEKKYFSASLEDLVNEKEAIDSFLKHYKNYIPKTQKLMENSAYHKMITYSIKPLSCELAEWASEPYEKNTSYPEQLRHPCMSGHVVRSKSELLIDQALFTHQIPFRYECPLKLGDLTFYPDFTIRHPESGKVYLWEHFGMMDVPSYSQNAFQKLQLYSTHGYIPTINFITSYETREHPLTIEKVEEIIQQYLS